MIEPEDEPTQDRAARVEVARQVCAACPVRRPCLAYALRTRPAAGVWAGFTPEEITGLIAAAARPARVAAQHRPAPGSQRTRTARGGGVMSRIPAELAAVAAVIRPYVQTTGPNEDYPPGGFTPQADRAWYLEAALAGIELGQCDRRIIAWLVQWDDYTARLVISLLVRARRAGYAEAAGAPAGTSGGPPACPGPGAAGGEAAP